MDAPGLKTVACFRQLSSSDIARLPRITGGGITERRVD